MRSVGIDEFKSHIDQYLRGIDGSALVITSGDRPVAALVPVSSDEDVEGVLLAASPRLREILDDAAKRFQAGQGIPHDEFWRLVESESGEVDPSSSST